MKRYAFCPVCGAALDRSASPPGGNNLHTCVSCGFEFWQNSKPAVGALIVRNVNGKPAVLLARRGIDPHQGMWDLPGGFLGNGEHPEQGLARELREELGVTICRPRLLAAEVDEYPREDFAEEARFVLSLYYRCDIAEGNSSLTPADDVAEAEWFPLERLPENIAFSGNRRVLAALRKAVQEESRTSSATG